MSLEKKLLFIYNPHAGKAMIKNYLSDIIYIFTKGGYEVTTHPTQERADATKEVVEKADGYDLIVCSGGDGTLDEVVTGMMQLEKKVPIGYIPAGSTNDFARSLRISNDMTKAAREIVGGRFYPCDAGSFNDTFFIYVAAFGLFTDVSYETDQHIKNVLGHAAYLLEGAKRLSSITSYEMKITCDDQVYEGEYIYGMVTNSRSVGGFSKLTGKTVDLNDGYFEVCLIKRPRRINELNQIILAILDDKIDSEYMQCFKAQQIEFKCQVEVPWTMDGENGGKHSTVNIKNEFQALNLIIPSVEAVAQAGYVKEESLEIS